MVGSHFELLKASMILFGISILSAGSNHLPVGGAGSAECLRVTCLSWANFAIGHEWPRKAR